jgi:hypothetical protein
MKIEDTFTVLHDNHRWYFDFIAMEYCVEYLRTAKVIGPIKLKLDFDGEWYYFNPRGMTEFAKFPKGNSYPDLNQVCKDYERTVNEIHY